MTNYGSVLRRLALGFALLVAILSQASTVSDHSHNQDVIAQRMDQFVSARDFYRSLASLLFYSGSTTNLLNM